VSTPARRITVDERERAILELLSGDAEPAPARAIHAAVTANLGDSVTPQAYYKVLARMEAAGRLDAADDPETGQRVYRLAAHLHPDTALTLDDVYAALQQLEPTDAVARVIDAQEYFEQHRTDTLRKAARALANEDPRRLLHLLICERARELQAEVDMLAEQGLRDEPLEQRVDSHLRAFHQLVYRGLGLSRAAVDAPWKMLDQPDTYGVRINKDALKTELARRVFGERCLQKIDVNSVAGVPDWNRAVVAGTDGSTYSSVMQIDTASAFVDDVGSQTLTFNTSAGFVSQRLGRSSNNDDSYHSVPMRRSAIDDPSNKGMLMAPFMYRYLSPSQYEHMAKCATDVVQWRVDEAVFTGTARSMGTGALLPEPRVHLRDGTITPQEREWGHYKLRNEYGEMVREGISHARKILDRLVVDDDPAVFAGAVKTTQTQLFSTVLNWYIARGSTATLGEPIDPAWDLTRAANIADNEAMTFLLSSLVDGPEKGSYWVTFQVMRPFSALTEYYMSAEHDDPGFWPDFFAERQQYDLQAYESGRETEPPYLANIGNLRTESYVSMCTRADYVTFYIGHTAGDPPPLLPRYEFMESLRAKSPEQAAARVSRNVAMIVGAIDRTSLSLDRDHNFLSRKTLVKIIPFVIYEAHEKCKAIGRQLDSEVRSIVVQNLQGIRNAKNLTPRQIRLLPESIRRHAERYKQALRDDDDKPSTR
jgi:hypothetical protein